jgi:hypothetical protein
MQESPISRQHLDAIKEPAHPQLNDKIARKELQKKYGEMNRSERIKNVLNWVFVVFIVIAASIAIGTVAVRLTHMALPVKWHWLTAEQIQGIDKLFFSGAIGGFIGSYFKKANENN